MLIGRLCGAPRLLRTATRHVCTPCTRDVPNAHAARAERLHARVRTPPMPAMATAQSAWHDVPPVADVAHYAARLGRAPSLVWPFCLRGVVVNVHASHEWTMLAPLHREGIDEYAFRVVSEPNAGTRITSSNIYGEVEVELDNYARGKWRAARVDYLRAPPTPRAP